MAHTSEKELLYKLNEAKKLIVIGGKYKHYSSEELTYTVIDIAIQEATENICVIYQPEYFTNKVLWVRDLEKFIEEIEIDDKKISRFTLLS
ncbi:MAG: DUF1653 domain-containing protein [bacterium]